jgi:hypothetical protein
MKIEAIKIIKNACFKMEDLQHFRDLKILYIKDYECSNLSKLSDFFKEFNSSNISHTLQHLFINFWNIQLNKRDEELFLRKFTDFKVPFGCNVYIKIESGRHDYIIYNSNDKKIIKCHLGEDEYYFFKDTYNVEYEKILEQNNRFFVKNNIKQLVKIQELINKE